MIRIRTLLALAILGICLPGFLHAGGERKRPFRDLLQRNGVEVPEEVNKKAEEKLASLREFMASLNITAEQRDQLLGIIKRNAGKIRDNLQMVRSSRTVFTTHIRTGAPSEDILRRDASNFCKALGEAGVELQTILLEVRKVLTDEQQAKLQTRREERQKQVDVLLDSFERGGIDGLGQEKKSFLGKLRKFREQKQGNNLDLDMKTKTEILMTVKGKKGQAKPIMHQLLEGYRTFAEAVLAPSPNAENIRSTAAGLTEITNTAAVFAANLLSEVRSKLDPQQQAKLQESFNNRQEKAQKIMAELEEMIGTGEFLDVILPQE